jgi:anti-sigma factor RsiW
MKCSTVKDELSRYVEGELPGRLQAAIARHLVACPACHGEAEGYRRAEEALRSLAAVVPAPDLSADLRRRLSAAAPPRPFRWLWAGTALAAVAAAAALLALRAPAPPAPSPVSVGPTAPAVTSSPEQFAAQPVTEEDGALRPTAPPAPSPAGSHRAAASSRRARRLRHDVLPVVSREDVVREAEEGEAVAVPTPRLLDSSTPRPDGVVLLVAAPQPPRPSSGYYGEVTLPDGGTSTYQETVERNAAGEPQSVKIAYQQTPPQAGVGNGG